MPEMTAERKDDKRYWLDDPRNVDKVYYALLAVCGLSALADLFYDKHVHFPWESWFNFHGWYGFVCCFLLVLAAKELRRLLMRDESYYD
jgi:hypothetical protein